METHQISVHHFFCPATLKEENDLNERPSFASSTHGWFRLCALGLSAKTKPSAASNREMAPVIANGNDLVHKTPFSDTAAIQMYRIAFLLLKFYACKLKLQ